jgi:hypothetical protein
MEINGHNIKTPMDHPWDFDPDWRNDIAKSLVDGSVIGHPCGSDEYINWQISFLRAVKDPDNGVLNRYECIPFGKSTACPERRAVLMAHRLHNSCGAHCLRDKVDAMLLCPELTINDIAGVLSSQKTHADPFDLQVYEKLYFNIRDEVGKVDTGCWLRELFATGGQATAIGRQDLTTYWRVLAFQGGHRLLFSRWQWPVITLEETEAERRLALARNSFCALEERTRFDDINNRDLVALYGHLQTETMELRKQGLLGGEGVSSSGEMGLLMEILQAAAPRALIPDESKLAQKEKAVKDKIELVKKTVRSHGGESDSLDDMSSKMANAVSRKSS